MAPAILALYRVYCFLSPPGPWFSPLWCTATPQGLVVSSRVHLSISHVFPQLMGPQMCGEFQEVTLHFPAFCSLPVNN